ncbi:MAG: hypothetical protein GF331_22315, partial [Chitinivibrionales bacterium]|nr:hypothetical protein [Chitinivibrionales bacterium]
MRPQDFDFVRYVEWGAEREEGLRAFYAGQSETNVLLLESVENSYQRSVDRGRSGRQGAGGRMGTLAMRGKLALCGLVCAAAAVGAAPSTPAVLDVTDSVVVTGIEPLGANVGKVMGGTNYFSNQFIPGGGFEPAYERWLRRVRRRGPNWFEWDGFGGVHMWDLDSTGFGNGARIRFYRIVNASGQPLDWATGGNMADATGADRVVFLGERRVPMPGGQFLKGGWIAQGNAGDTNRVYVDSAIGLERGDYAFIMIEKAQLASSEINGRLYQFNSNIGSAGHLFKPGDWNAKLVPHPGTPLPQEFLDDDPGKTCYELSPTNTETHNVGKTMFHAYDQREGLYYGALTPGAPYRVEVWLRQEGLGNGGLVRFNSNQSYSSISANWNVTGTWQKYTHDFTGPAYPDGDPWHHNFGFEVTGPGKLWIDNWKVFQNDAVHENRAFTPCTLGFNEYLRSIPPIGQKPSVRFMGTFGSTSPMERMLSDWSSSRVDFMWNLQAGTNMTIPHCMYWAFKSGDSPATRIVPYLTLRVEYVEEDWRAVVEYLGVPYDPSIDTPAGKPFAYMRYKQRGNVGTPWTDEFREIVIEYGNESWHNGAGNYGWHGFGVSQFTWSGGIEYGLFANYMFDRTAGAMPEWTQYNLGSKIKFALNGGYFVGPDEYGEISVKRTTGAVKYVTHANYVGPKWETGDTPNMVFDDDGLQRTLVAAGPEFKEGYLAKHAEFRDLAAGQGVDYDLIAYEGGPSGYYVSSDNDTAKEVAEQYGKSVAMAVAALDGWLYSSYVGYKHQNYLIYACGRGWTSHTQAIQGGFRQHAGWKALALRNNYARGDRMLLTTFSSIPTFRDTVVDTGEVPLVAAYTLTNEARSVYSVFVLSRKLAGTHNGSNFGDGYTPVTINLPFSQTPQAIYLHKITRPDGSPSDPADNNRTAENVVITSSRIPTAQFAQSFALNAARGADDRGIPEAGIYLYVFALDSASLSVRGVDLSMDMHRLNPGSAAATTGAWVSSAAVSTPTPVGAPVPRRGSSPEQTPPAGTAAALQIEGPVVPVQNAPAVLASAISSAGVNTPLNVLDHDLRSRWSPGSTVATAHAQAVSVREPFTPRDMAWSDVQRAVPVVLVSASSSRGINTALNALDRDLRSRWSPEGLGEQWLGCDLVDTYPVDGVVFVRYLRGSRSVPFAVEVSTDGTEYARVHEGTIRGRGTRTERVAFGSATEARHVRVVFKPGRGAESPHVYEVSVT